MKLIFTQVISICARITPNAQSKTESTKERKKIKCSKEARDKEEEKREREDVPGKNKLSAPNM